MSGGVPQEQPDVTCKDGGYVRVRGRPLARAGLESVKRLRMHYTTQVCEGERGWEQSEGGGEGEGGGGGRGATNEVRECGRTLR